jgi:hypothetical protein
MAIPVDRRVFWDVEFPKAPKFNKIILSAELSQNEDTHDVLCINFKGALDRHTGVAIQKGDPIKFTWQTGPYRQVFIGFVQLIEKNVTLQRSFTRIVCVNNSSILKVPSKKVHRNVTADQIASLIGKEAGFYTETSNHPFVHVNLSQSGQTHWQLLRHLSKKTGYALRIENKKLIFKNRGQIIAEKIKSAPVFFHFDNPPQALVGHQTLYSFTALDAVESPEINQGDIGLELHNKDGVKYSFDAGTGKSKHYSLSDAVKTKPNWGKTYGY